MSDEFTPRELMSLFCGYMIELDRSGKTKTEMDYYMAGAADAMVYLVANKTSPAFALILQFAQATR